MPEKGGSRQWEKHNRITMFEGLSIWNVGTVELGMTYLNCLPMMEAEEVQEGDSKMRDRREESRWNR